jgi:hypothetical protein
LVQLEPEVLQAMGKAPRKLHCQPHFIGFGNSLNERSRIPKVSFTVYRTWNEIGDGYGGVL